jgi:hypothetical protein
MILELAVVEKGSDFLRDLFQCLTRSCLEPSPIDNRWIGRPRDENNIQSVCTAIGMATPDFGLCSLDRTGYRSNMGEKTNIHCRYYFASGYLSLELATYNIQKFRGMSSPGRIWEWTI